MHDSIGFVCVLALALVACSETSTTASGGGAAGVGGAAGSGVGGGGGSAADLCLPLDDRCTSVEIEPHESCCEPGVPDQADACDGTESLVNPATCAPTGISVVYKLTMMEVEEDCDVGYDLDVCDGETCVRGGLAPGEGLDGIDNALAGFGPLLVSGDLNLGSLNKAFSDSLCGMAGAECLDEIPPLEVRLVVDASFSEGCANVSLLVGGEATSHVLNLSEDGCLSGTLGTILLERSDLYGSLNESVVRMTISSAGFSHGLLGGAMDGDMTVAIFEIVFPGSADPLGSPFDLAVSTTPTPEGLAQCDGFSATFRIGGVAEDPRTGGS